MSAFIYLVPSALLISVVAAGYGILSMAHSARMIRQWRTEPDAAHLAAVRFPALPR